MNPVKKIYIEDVKCKCCDADFVFTTDDVAVCPHCYFLDIEKQLECEWTPS